jgi:predicted DNA-binding transcriptional regulator YafY
MRADRLLAIVLLLQVRTRMTARELALQLEVCERTIYRDLDALSAAGVPVIADRGPGGGVALRPGYRADLSGFTPSEARALFAPGAAQPLADLGFGGDVASARRKLLAALPAGTRGEAERAAQRLHLDPGPWWQVAEEPGWLRVLVEAVWSARRLHLHYRRADAAEPYWRIVEPLGLVAKAGTWYLVAHRDGMPRIYRVSRVREARLDDASFERPAQFDLAAFWKAESARFEASVGRYPVVLHVREALSAFSQRVTKAVRPTLRPLEGGDPQVSRVALEFESLEEACAQLLALGAVAEVTEPAELRGALIARCRETLRLYQSDAPRGRRTRDRSSATC